MKNAFFLIMVTVLLGVTGCSNQADQLSVDDVFNKVNAAHEDMDYFELAVTDNLEGYGDINGVFKMDRVNNVTYFERPEFELITYQDNDDFYFAEYGQPSSYTQAPKEIYHRTFNNYILMYENILTYLATFDQNIVEHFSLEETETSYTLLYEGDDQSQRKVAEGFTEKWSEQTAGLEHYQLEFANVEPIDIEIKVIIDKETFFIEEVDKRIHFKTLVNNQNKEYDESYLFEYVSYDEHDTIEKPAIFAEAFNPSDEDATAAQEAADYLEALIQATVYGNVDGYVEKVPGSASQEEKQEQGEAEKSLFQSFYKENTRRNLGDFAVTEEELDDFVTIFMLSMEQTDYQVIDTQQVDEDEFVVTLSIEGFDETTAELDMMQMLTSELFDGEIEEADVLSRQMELAEELYRSEDYLLPAVPIRVHVLRNSPGEYMVLLQDQYLYAFVQ
ncbi:DUF6612 family protein [Amphibacillus jilinensis]|uniref:DUF6612 family protein n=1 Tax=Amphibacillus jilinensis TaxID=1216008 RepID=UPI00036BDB03|nr:DUF6612 family protein [Amphibacillus jilinensis]